MEYLVGGDGPPLVCFHAASGVRVTAAHEMLARTRTLYLPIAPGFDATAPLEEGAEMSDVAARMADFIESVLCAPVDVAGHSFGGWIACWLAVLRPDLVRRLILECPAGFRPEGIGGLDGDPATLLRRAFAHPEKRRPEQKSPEMVNSNRRMVVQYSRALASDEALIAQLSAIKAETLIIYGRKDGVIPEESALLLNDRIKGAKLVYVDDAAHNIEVDQPETFAEIVTDFLSTADGR